VRVHVQVVLSDRRPDGVEVRSSGGGVVAGGGRRPPVALVMEQGVHPHPDAPAQAGQHQQQTEADEAHADDFGRRAHADRVGYGNRHGADQQEAGADADDDQRPAVVRRDDGGHRGRAASGLGGGAAACPRPPVRPRPR